MLYRGAPLGEGQGGRLVVEYWGVQVTSLVESCWGVLVGQVVATLVRPGVLQVTSLVELCWGVGSHIGAARGLASNFAGGVMLGSAAGWGL